MPKSKARKSHKRKLASRKISIQNDKKRVDKAKREYIMELIKREQEKGLFDNVSPMDIPLIDPIIEGPSI